MGPVLRTVLGAVFSYRHIPCSSGWLEVYWRFKLTTIPIIISIFQREVFYTIEQLIQDQGNKISEGNIQRFSLVTINL